MSQDPYAFEVKEAAKKEIARRARVLKSGLGKAKRFVWRVEIEVAEVWVADGFDLSEERMHGIMCRALSSARMSEIRCKVLKAPPVADVRKVQGYKD